MYLIYETVVFGIPASETVVFNSISSKPVVVTSLSFSSFYSFNFSSFLFTQNATPKITIFSYYYHRECFVLLYTCIQVVTLPWESAQFYHWINLTYISFPRISLHTHWKIILQMPFFCLLRFTCLLSSSQFPRLLMFPFPFKYFLMFLSKFFLCWCWQLLCLHTLCFGDNVWCYKVLGGKDFIFQRILECCRH